MNSTAAHLLVMCNMTKDKYVFNTAQIEEKCYLLLACFAGSKQVHAFCASLADLGIPKISVLESSIVKNYLISVAVQLRMMDDAMKSHGRSHHIPSFCVGVLRNESGQAQDQLDIREACNKIIHAKSIRIFETVEGGAEHLAQTIYLGGTKGDKAWNAEIEIEHFLRAALFVSNRYDEDWEVSAYT